MKFTTAIKNFYVVCGVSAISLAALACGGNGASNNDQGVSVTLLGLFSSTGATTGGGTGGAAQTACGGVVPAPLSGAYTSLSSATPEPGAVPAGAGDGPDGGFIAYIGIQNNLWGQAFQADRLLMDFYVPGASTQPPSTNGAIYLLAGPPAGSTGTQGTTTTGTGSGGGTGSGTGGTTTTTTPVDIRRPITTTLPPSYANICNRNYSQQVVLPPAIKEWLNFNRDSLPEAPFVLEATYRVSGVSTSGDRLETNDVTLQFTVLPETLVPPTSGETDDTPTTTAEVTTTEEDTSGVEQLSEAFEVQELTESEE